MWYRIDATGRRDSEQGGLAVILPSRNTDRGALFDNPPENLIMSKHEGLDKDLDGLDFGKRVTTQIGGWPEDQDTAYRLAIVGTKMSHITGQKVCGLGLDSSN